MTDSRAHGGGNRIGPAIILRAGMIAAVGLWLLAGWAMPAMAGQVTVFAAASLKTALDNIAAMWRAETGHDVVLSLGGSSALARQIQHGAPADIFISANIAWMDALERDGLIEPASRFDLAGNRLVLIAHGDHAGSRTLSPGFDLAGLLGQGRLAMALVDAVPAGIYGKQALQALGMWDQAVPRIAQSDNVRAALALVASGEAPAGIVYATDARVDARVGVVGRFPEDSHDAIRYPAAVIGDSRNHVAGDFMRFLKSDAAQAVLEGHGFVRLAQDRANGPDHARMDP